MPRATANGIEICYESFGDTSRPALVLLMGLGCQMVLWADGFCRQLVARGYRVIRFDHRDLGRSSKMAHLGTPALLPMLLQAQLGRPLPPPYTLRDMAKDTLGLLDALDIERAHVVGASMGGMIAQHMALMAPARLRSMTLWMTTTRHRPSIPKLRVIREVVRRPPADREGNIALNLARLRSLSGGIFPFDEEMTRGLVTEAWDRDPDQGCFVRQLAAIMAERPRQEALRRVRVPTLVMHGSLDPMIPVWHARETARIIPNAQLRVFEGLGHDYPTILWPQLVDTIDQHARKAG